LWEEVAGGGAPRRWWRTWPATTRVTRGPRSARQWGFYWRWRTGLGRRPTRGGDAAAARLKASGGGAWRHSMHGGDGGRARHEVQADGGVVAWLLQRGGGADGARSGSDLGLAGPDLGVIGTAATSRRHSPSVMEDNSPPLGCRAARCPQARMTYPVLLLGCALWRSELWLEFVDVGRRPWNVDCADDSGEPRVGGGGSSLWPCGWRGVDVGGLWCWRCFSSGSPGSCVGGLPWRQRAWAEDGERHEGFSGQKLCALAPAAAMPAGILS
jgi:hypothetical protein